MINVREFETKTCNTRLVGQLVNSDTPTSYGWGVFHRHYSTSYPTIILYQYEFGTSSQVKPCVNGGMNTPWCIPGSTTAQIFRPIAYAKRPCDDIVRYPWSGRSNRFVVNLPGSYASREMYCNIRNIAHLGTGEFLLYASKCAFCGTSPKWKQKYLL